MTTESVFANYWREVADIFGNKGKPTKWLAIQFSRSPAASIDGNDSQIVRRLYEALDKADWASKKGANWKWRPKPPKVSKTNESGEVILERLIVETGSSTKWTCQMSTSSGVQQPTTLNKRRAIDLVRLNATDHYSFVELKVGSDNPLHAAFEILSYALAYLHARNNDQKGSGHHDVMSATHIELVVLGPEKWYHSYEDNEQSFKRLADNLKIGLNAISGKKPQFDFSFQKYSRFDDDWQKTADGILELAEDWK